MSEQSYTGFPFVINVNYKNKVTPTSIFNIDANQFSANLNALANGTAIIDNAITTRMVSDELKDMMIQGVANSVDHYSDLPATEDTDTIYIVKETDGSGENGFYKFDGTNWNKIADYVQTATITDLQTQITDTREVQYKNGFDRINPDTMPDVSWDDATRTMSFAVKSGQTDFHFWANNNKIIKTTTQSIQIPDTTGRYYFYFDNNGDLQYILAQNMTETHFDLYAIAGFVYWNATTGVGKINPDEMHGVDMPGTTHLVKHLTTGALYSSGLNINGLVDGSDTYTGSDSGIFYDEDIPNILQASTGHPFLYRSGTDGAWVWTTPDLNVSYNNGGTYDVWNEFDGTTWKLSEGTSSTDFWIIFALATPLEITKLISQNAYSTKGKARDAIESEISRISTADLPNPEMVWLGAWIVKRTGDLQEMADGSTFYDLRGARGGGVKTTSAVYAEDVLTDTTNFNGNLSSTDTDVQTALETIDSMTSGGGSSSPQAVLLGDCYVAENIVYFRISNAMTLAKIRIGVVTAPTGASLIVDVNYGTSPTALTSIFSTQSNRPTITSGNYTADSGTPDTTSLASGGWIGISVDQVGSTVTGKDLTIELL